MLTTSPTYGSLTGPVFTLGGATFPAVIGGATCSVLGAWAAAVQSSAVPEHSVGLLAAISLIFDGF